MFRLRAVCVVVLLPIALHVGASDGGAQFAAMVQYRPPLGLWDRWAKPGPLLCRPRDQETRQVEVGLRASATPCLFHPVRRRRSRQRWRDHGSLGARSQALQIWLRHRLEFFQIARRERKAFRRRKILRPDVVLEDRRSRGGSNQVRWYHPARRENGHRRCRSSRHRGFYRMESEGGTKSRRARHRLENFAKGDEGYSSRLRQLRRAG